MELYKLQKDPNELQDLSQEYLSIVHKLLYNIKESHSEPEINKFKM